MSLAYFMDVHVPFQITRALRKQGIDVLTAQDDDAAKLSDSNLVDRATALSRVMVSHDEDMLREAQQRQRSGHEFSGVVYGPQKSLSIGQVIRDLLMISEVMDPDEMMNRVEHIPL
jgi:hypothetical protein